MGIHSRVAKEQERAKRTRRNLIKAGAGVVLVGALGVAGQGFLAKDHKQESLTEEANKAKAEFLGSIACTQQDDITITFGKPKEAGEGYNGTALASTNFNKIVVDKGIAQTKVRDVILHEMVHACVPVEPVLFDTPFIPPSEPTARIVGSEGFKVLYAGAGNDYDYSTFIEEGAAEYIASGVPGYTPSNNDGYRAVRTLTQELVAISGSIREHVVGQHESSDLLGFIGGIYGVEGSQVTAEQIDTIQFAYQDAMTSGHAPTIKELGAAYGIAPLHG